MMPYMEDMFHIWQVRTVPYKRSYGTVHRTGIPYRMCTHTHSWKLATPRDYSRVMPYMEHPIVDTSPIYGRCVRYGGQRSKVKRSPTPRDYSRVMPYMEHPTRAPYMTGAYGTEVKGHTVYGTEVKGHQVAQNQLRTNYF